MTASWDEQDLNERMKLILSKEKDLFERENVFAQRMKDEA